MTVLWGGQSAEAVFPCIARIIPTAIFNKRSPIVVGVDVIEGVMKIGTPLCVVVAAGESRRGEDGELIESTAGVLTIGRVASIENNHAPLMVCRCSGGAARAAVARARLQQIRWEPITAPTIQWPISRTCAHTRRGGFCLLLPHALVLARIREHGDHGHRRRADDEPGA